MRIIASVAFDFSDKSLRKKGGELTLFVVLAADSMQRMAAKGVRDIINCGKGQEQRGRRRLNRNKCLRPLCFFVSLFPKRRGISIAH